MKKLLLYIILFFQASLGFSQGEPPKINIKVEDGVNPWNHLSVNNSAEKFQFVIVTDRTGGLRPGVFASAIPKLNLLQPEFVMSVGDLISGYTENEEVIDREWDEFDGFIKELDMPFFYVPGNHDYINEVMAKKWKERLGKDYYHFVYKDVLFLCLNTEELTRGAGRGSIEDEQYAYIEKTLAENPEAKWTMIFMHQPLWDQENSGRWEDVEKLLAPRKHTVFVGHRHRYVKYERNNGKYFILATTGGGSGLRGPNFGEFDHVVWVTMTDEGPILANLMLEGIWDENVNTEDYYAFSRPLMGQKPWEVSPIYAEAGSFGGGELAIKMTNNSDVPMLGEISIESSKDLWAQSDEIEALIAPNSVQTWNIPLLTKDGATLKEATPMSLEFEATYKPEGKPELSLEGEEKVGPIFIKKLRKADQKIQIDGKNEEWEKLPYSSSGQKFHDATPITHKGDQDCLVQFDLSYDDEFMYVFAKVDDDQIESSSAHSTLEQDGLFVVLDARPREESIKGKGERIFRNIMVFGGSPGETTPIYHWQDRYPAGTQIAVHKTGNTYYLELAVPTSYLNEKSGGDWDSFRINLFAADSDYKGHHMSQIYWKPDWREDENVLGSGLFEK